MAAAASQGVPCILPSPPQATTATQPVLFRSGRVRAETILLTGMPKKDIREALRKLEKLSEMQFKQVMEKTPVKLSVVMTTLEEVFLTAEAKLSG